MVSPSKKKEKMVKVLLLLQKNYPDAKTALEYKKHHELLISTILSAQCTDKRVNLVAKDLFKKYKTVKDFASCSLVELEKDIHSTGFYKNKAKNIKGCCQMLMQKFGGKIPDTMEALIQLPGVGRKTANVILPNIFGKNEGICVDTHMIRLSQRIGFSKYKDPIKIEKDLMEITPQKDWMAVTNLLIQHGRQVCNARKPLCEICAIQKYCDYYCEKI